MPAHQALIRLLAASGDRAGALAQYRECVRTLTRELGVPPLSETQRLYEEVNEGTFEMALPVERPDPVRVETSSSPGLVGRSREHQRRRPGRLGALGDRRARRGPRGEANDEELLQGGMPT